MSWNLRMCFSFPTNNFRCALPITRTIPIQLSMLVFFFCLFNCLCSIILSVCLFGFVCVCACVCLFACFELFSVLNCKTCSASHTMRIVAKIAFSKILKHRILMCRCCTLLYLLRQGGKLVCLLMFIYALLRSAAPVCV